MADLYLKIPSNTSEKMMPYDISELNLTDGRLYTLDLVTDFRGETVNTTAILKRKLSQLFSENHNHVEFIDIKVSRLRGFFVKQVVVDKRNFLTFVTHRNYGDFQGDYSVRVIQYIENQGELTEVIPHPESPLQHAAAHSARPGRDKDLTITIRRGENENSPPARGRVMSNLLSDKREMIAVLNHFNLLGKTDLAAKPTPGIPTIEISLKEPVVTYQDTDPIATNPMLIYEPSPQMHEAGSSELWAHIDVEKGPKPKKLTIEGIVGRASIDEVLHRLKYHGDIVSEPEQKYWSDNEDDPLSKVATGDLVIVMKLRIEINFLFIGNNAFKVFYPNQPIQCSHCWSWSHRLSSCWAKDQSRQSLLQDYVRKWKNQVGYEPRRPMTPQEATGTSSSGSDSSVFTATSQVQTPARSKKEEKKHEPRAAPEARPGSRGSATETTLDQEVPPKPQRHQDPPLASKPPLAPKPSPRKTRREGDQEPQLIGTMGQEVLSQDPQDSVLQVKPNPTQKAARSSNSSPIKPKPLDLPLSRRSDEEAKKESLPQGSPREEEKIISPHGSPKAKKATLGRMSDGEARKESLPQGPTRGEEMMMKTTRRTMNKGTSTSSESDANNEQNDNTRSNKLMDSPANILEDFRNKYQDDAKNNVDSDPETEARPRDDDDKKADEDHNTGAASEDEASDKVGEADSESNYDNDDDDADNGDDETKSITDQRPAKTDTETTDRRQIKKRKASPLERDQKTTGTGRRIYAEKLKSTFFAKVMKIKEKAERKDNPLVTKQNLKLELELLVEKYYEDMFNPTGTLIDPAANANWEAMMKEKDLILKMLVRTK